MSTRKAAAAKKYGLVEPMDTVVAENLIRLLRSEQVTITGEQRVHLDRMEAEIVRVSGLE